MFRISDFVLRICFCLVAVPGCAGYHVGNQSLYPANIETVYVPVFPSASFRHGLGEQLTEAVIKEIQKRTPYTVVNDSNADSILSGRITGETKRTLIANLDAEPREVEMNLQVKVQWIDRHSNTIREGAPIPVPSELLMESGTLVPEFGQSIATAQQKAVQRLAQQIVNMMEAPW